MPVFCKKVYVDYLYTAIGQVIEADCFFCVDAGIAAQGHTHDSGDVPSLLTTGLIKTIFTGLCTIAGAGELLNPQKT